jgi:hypothetical protein
MAGEDDGGGKKLCALSQISRMRIGGSKAWKPTEMRRFQTVAQPRKIKTRGAHR